MNHPDLALRDAVAAANEGRADVAIAIIDGVLQRQPQHPVALFLSGVLLLEQAAFGAAEARLRRAFALDPQRPATRTYLARALRGLDRADNARVLLDEGLRWAPEDPGLQLERALTAMALGDLTGATAMLEAVLRLMPGWSEAALPLADLLMRRGAYRAAQATLDQARTVVEPDTDDITRGALDLALAACLKRQRRHDEAIAALARAEHFLPDNATLLMERASLLQHLGRWDEAVATFRALLAVHPLDLTAHLHLNELLYRQRRDDDLLRSFDDALAQVPGAALLPSAKGTALLKLERAAEARAAFEQALAIEPGRPDAMIGQARAIEQQAGIAAALPVFEAAAARHPADAAVLRALAGARLRTGDPASARAIAEQILQHSPFDQEALALLGLALRQLGDPAEQQLNDYDRLVRVYDLPAPDGWPSMAAFNDALGRYLDDLQTDRRENYSQTLRGGTRVYDEVFNNGHALADALRLRIEEAIRDYIAHLPDDPGHKLGARRGAGFGYAGSWSSRMTSGGFHLNHIHPQGWISSAYYVRVPPESDDAGAHQGWLAFGRPTPYFGDHPARRMVQPVEGRLVLFPSYLWHGTTPFASAEARMTIAFDVVPVA